MSADRILDAIGRLDAAILEETDALRGRKQARHSWVRWGALAACLCLLLIAAVLRPGLPPIVPPVQTDPTEATDAQPLLPGDAGWSWEPVFNTAQDYLEAETIPLPGYFTEELDAQRLEAVLPSVRMEWMQFFGDKVGFNGEGTAVDVQLRVRTPKTGIRVFFTDGTSSQGCCVVFDGEPVREEYNGVTFEIYQYADFFGKKSFEAYAGINGYHFTFQMDTGVQDPAEQRKIFAQVLACFTYYEEGRPDLSAFIPERIPEYKEAFLFHADALQDPDLGAYMLREVPFGYDGLLGSERGPVYRFKNQHFDYLYGQWYRSYLGYSITWVAEVSPQGGAAIGIDAEELTLEKVQQAASKRKNSANLSAWHIDLEVRYGDVLVRVETVGPEPEWVYAQLQALQIP